MTVVLPCLNEEGSVGRVVEESLQALRSAGLRGEVLVVDNGSTDASISHAREAGARVIHESRRGYGRAVRTGIAAAKGTIVVIADADWTYDMTKVPLLVDPIKRGLADLAMGARLHEADRRKMPVLHRYVGTPALTAFIRTAAGFSGLTDSQTGFRCFRKDAINQLKLRADGMELTSEMLLKAAHHGLRVIEIPTGYRERVGESKLNTLSDGLRNLRILVLLVPEIFFIAPGVALFLVGALLHLAALLPSRGVEIGSLRWQPVFFATIALILGLQTVLVGLVFAWRRLTLGLTHSRLSRFFAFVQAPSFARAVLFVGCGAFVAGIALDGMLYGGRLFHESSTSAIASLAQSLILAGGSLGSFALIVFWLHWDQRLNGDGD